MKHALLILCLAWAATATAQEIAATPTPAPSPTPSATPAGSPTPTPPAPAQAPATPPWLVAESTLSGVQPGADPSTTLLRSKFKPIVVKQGPIWTVVFEY